LIAPTARNAAILRAAGDLLAATLTVISRESAVQQVEAATERELPRLMRRLRSRWSRRIGVFLAVVDVAAVLAAWAAVRVSLQPREILAVAAVVLVISNRADLHRSRLELSVVDDLPAYLLASALASVAMAGVHATEGVRVTPQTSVAFGLMCLLFLTVGRACGYHVVRLLRRSRLVAHPVVIVGSGDVGQRLAGAILAHPEYGLTPVGFVDSRPHIRGHTEGVRPVLGGLADLPAVLEQFGVNDVVFAFGAHPDAHLVRLVRACVRMDLQVFVVPRYFELWGADRRARTEVLWGVPLVRLRRWPLRPSQAWMKRCLDIACAIVGLVLLSPVLVACAIAVRVETGPGILFRQVRVGRGGETFTLLKFRTMRPAGDEAEWRWSIDGDQRIGKVGRLLRRFSLDELPQLVNVLLGHMSMVGPRPERPFFVQNFAQHFSRYADRHRVATGLTGWAQVNGLRGDTSIEDRVTFDNYYIDNWSMWNDVKIIIRTFLAVLRRQSPPPRDRVADFASAAEAASNTS
jgi:exopolysaccharide biosynthesis polyprenyl glycosylphosphotransferase